MIWIFLFILWSAALFAFGYLFGQVTNSSATMNKQVDQLVQRDMDKAGFKGP